MSSSNSLYSIILAHYRQQEYIFTALDSVFAQTYPDIELIVVDDATEGYDKQQVADYIDSHKGKNIKRVELVINEKNLGTIRSLNRAVKKAQGEFFHFFAADDQLANPRVAEDFVSTFNLLGKDAEIISAMAQICDEFLVNTGEFFVSPVLQKNYGALDAKQQFELCSVACIFPMGGTCMRSSLFLRLGPFDERFFLVEDWPFFIKILRNGIKVYTALFTALNHREGGVSRNILQNAPFQMLYQQDLFRIIEIEVFPYLSQLSLGTQIIAFVRYMERYRTYRRRGGRQKCLAEGSTKRYNPRLLCLQLGTLVAAGYQARLKFFSKATVLFFVLLLISIHFDQAILINPSFTVTFVSTLMKMLDFPLLILFGISTFSLLLYYGIYILHRFYKYLHS